MFKLVHDHSYAEDANNHQYIIIKMFDEKDEQVGQVKLAFHEGTDKGDIEDAANTSAHVHITTSGRLSMEHKHE